MRMSLYLWSRLPGFFSRHFIEGTATYDWSDVCTKLPGFFSRHFIEGAFLILVVFVIVVNCRDSFPGTSLRGRNKKAWAGFDARLPGFFSRHFIEGLGIICKSYHFRMAGILFPALH